MQACLNFKCLYSNNNDFNICTTTTSSCLWRQSYNIYNWNLNKSSKISNMI